MLNEVLLVHAAHQNAVNFEELTWGNPLLGVYGRASKALQYIANKPGVQLYLGCGSLGPNQPVVSELVYNLMLEKGGEVAAFAKLGFSAKFDLLKNGVYLDKVSQTTVDEIQNAGRFCSQAGISRLTILSSPTHLPRCLRDALAERERPGSTLQRCEIGIVASDTNFADASAASVTIFEPPHRSDRHQVRIDRSVRSLFPHLGTQDEAEKVDVILKAMNDPDMFSRIYGLVS